MNINIVNNAVGRNERVCVLLTMQSVCVQYAEDQSPEARAAAAQC